MRPLRRSLLTNTSASPLSDKRVREAIHLALDRAALAGAHFGSQALPSNQLLPPGFLGYDENLHLPAPDVERAKALLAEADLAEGFPLRIWVPDQPRPYLPDPLGTGSAIAAMLKAIGIDASVNPMRIRRLLDNRDRAYRAWLIGWEAQTSDPDSMWYWHFGPANANTEGHYANADLHKLLLEAQRTAATDRRRTLYESAAALVAADVPRLYLAYTRPIVAVGDRVQNYVPGAMGYDAFAGVTLAQPAPDATAPPPLEGFLPPTATPTAALAGPIATTPAAPDGSPTAGTTESTAASTPASVTPAPPSATPAGPARSRSAP